MVEAEKMIRAYDPTRYLTYAEMVQRLQRWAADYPHLCQVSDVGRSPEGRTIWAVALTNRATGPDREKPGYLVDANIHAGEVTGGAAALYSIDWLLTHHGAHPVATALLDTRAFYVLPRLAVDGVERYLTTPAVLRSVPRVYPEPEELPGLLPEDINADGRILSMRLADPAGDWKADAADPRILVARRPEDGPDGGPYYRVFPEGQIRDWDGRGIPPVRQRWRLDLNRNYPAFWSPEGRQPGAGRYPLSEPETRALALFLLDHPNIGAYVSYHTTGQVLLRPPSNGGDEKLNPADLELFRRVGEAATRLADAPCKSTYDAFGYPGQEALVKGADDWAYEHLGVQAYTFELWSVDVRAGARSYSRVGVKGLLKLTEAEWLEDERKRLAWSDRELGGAGFIPWTPFVHPQLGPVEIGGWDLKRCLQNPPEGPLLAETVSGAACFTFQHALATPLLAAAAQAEPLGGGLYRISARVWNRGGLPTHATHMALQVKAVRPIAVRLELPAGGRLAAGRERVEVEHLDGWLTAGDRAARTEAWVDWVAALAPGAEVRVTVDGGRAGVARALLKV